MATVGISPKVFAPALALVVAIVVQWIATGDWDRVQTAEAVGLALTALIGFFAPPGIVVNELDEPGAPK